MDDANDADFRQRRPGTARACDDSVKPPGAGGAWVARSLERHNVLAPTEWSVTRLTIARDMCHNSHILGASLTLGRDRCWPRLVASAKPGA